MDGWNEGRQPLEKRHLMYYKVIGDMPSIDQDANLHAIAHLYASDRNGLFTVSSRPSWFFASKHRILTLPTDPKFPRCRRRLHSHSLPKSHSHPTPRGRRPVPHRSRDRKPIRLHRRGEDRSYWPWKRSSLLAAVSRGWATHCQLVPRWALAITPRR
jgi:hypothetical protein